MLRFMYPKATTLVLREGFAKIKIVGLDLNGKLDWEDCIQSKLSLFKYMNYLASHC